MKHSIRALLLLLTFALCLLPLGAAAEAESTTVSAWIYYVPDGWWPTTTDAYAVNTKAEIAGEGYYTASFTFTADGWTPTGSGAQKLQLIVQNGAVEGSVMDGMYLGVSAIRINGTAIAVGNAGYGPCGYEQEGVFTADDSYCLIYDQWMADNSTVPYGLKMWNGEEATVTAIDPTALTDVVEMEIDFFVTDTQGELPSSDPEPVPEPVSVSMPAFTVPSQTFTNLFDSDIPVAAMVNAAPAQISVYYWDDKIKATAINTESAAYRGTNYNERTMTLVNGVWETAAEQTEEQFAADGGYVTFSQSVDADDSWSLEYWNGGLSVISAYTGDNQLLIFAGTKSYITLRYYTTDGMWVSDAYWFKTGALAEQTITNNGSISWVEYNSTGGLEEFYMQDEAVNYYRYTLSDGWQMRQDGVFTASEAPAGYDYIDAAWIYRTLPPQMPGARVTIPMPESWDAVLPADLTEIGAQALTNLAITSVYIPEEAETIGSGAFSGCTSLKWVYIPASVTAIADDAFDGCSDAVIFAAEGSAAEAFAEENEILCVLR